MDDFEAREAALARPGATTVRIIGEARPDLFLPTTTARILPPED